RNVAPSRQLNAYRNSKVHHLNLRSPPNPLSPRRVLPFHHDLKHLPHVPLIAPRSNLLLLVIQNRQPPSLLRIRNRILQPQRRSVRTRRILKRKHAVIPNDVHQAKPLLKPPLPLPRESNNQIAGNRYIPPSRLNPANALQILIPSIK